MVSEASRSLSVDGVYQYSRLTVKWPFTVAVSPMDASLRSNPSGADVNVSSATPPEKTGGTC